MVMMKWIMIDYDVEIIQAVCWVSKVCNYLGYDAKYDEEMID